MKAYLIFDDIEKHTIFIERVWEYIKAKGKEMEIPEGATLFQYQTNEGHLYHFYREEGIRSYGHFPIPRLKKVKKTVYLYVQNFGGKTVYSVFDNDYENKGYPVEIEVDE